MNNMNKYILKDTVSTRSVLRMIRERHEHMVDLYAKKHGLTEFEWDERRTRKNSWNVDNYYTFGLSSQLRACVTVIYTPATRELIIVTPHGYTNWDKADSYTRLRIRIHDGICTAMTFGRMVEEEIYND